jgi:hypothetical protein
VKVVSRTIISSATLAAIASLILYFVLNGSAALGLIAGVGLAVVSLFSFGLLGKIIAVGGSVPRQVVALTTIVWLLKLPILWFTVATVVGAGMQVTGCFLGGLALVYSLLVLTATLDARSAGEGHF